MDNKRKCSIEGCNNVGEWNCIKRGKVYRRKLCSTHRMVLKKQTTGAGKRTYAREIFKRDNCSKCEYCGWNGPCDVHRPIPNNEGGNYVKINMRSACPNCHRLITKGLMIDKFKQ